MERFKWEFLKNFWRFLHVRLVRMKFCLTEDGNGWFAAGANLNIPVMEDIPVMLIDKAEPFDT